MVSARYLQPERLNLLIVQSGKHGMNYILHQHSALNLYLHLHYIYKDIYGPKETVGSGQDDHGLTAHQDRAAAEELQHNR